MPFGVSHPGDTATEPHLQVRRQILKPLSELPRVVERQQQSHPAHNLLFLESRYRCHGPPELGVLLQEHLPTRRHLETMVDEKMVGRNGLPSTSMLHLAPVSIESVAHRTSRRGIALARARTQAVEDRPPCGPPPGGTAPAGHLTAGMARLDPWRLLSHISSPLLMCYHGHCIPDSLDPSSDGCTGTRHAVVNHLAPRRSTVSPSPVSTTPLGSRGSQRSPCRTAPGGCP